MAARQERVFFAERVRVTLVPHVLALLDEIEEPYSDGLVRVTTRRAKQKPWSEIRPRTGIIPAHWVRPVLTSPQMMVCIPALRETRAIVPTDTQGRLLDTPGDSCPFWKGLDEIYATHRGIGKSTPKTLLAQFDFRSKLSAQLSLDPALPWTVLYPSSGDIMRGSRVQTGTGIADSTLFWFTVQTYEEAGFLVAILNAACLRRAFEESRDSGRHFQLHPWRKVPIPSYDDTRPPHRRLAELCIEAEEIAQEVAAKILAEKPKKGQIGISQAIRSALRGSETGQEIEALVTDLLPEYSTSESNPE